MKKQAISQCGICGHSSLDLLWDLPKLPLTEKYGPYSPDLCLHTDQQLLFCNECGHVQLGHQISAEMLYTPSEYLFRTSQSKTAQAGTKLFFNFYNTLKKERVFRSLLDIGGNDLFLAKMVDTAERCVIDPVCAPQNGQLVEGIKILGKFIEEVSFAQEALKPDLVFCRHVLEHIAKPQKLLSHLFQNCHPDALYIFEIPCFENLVEANRFDAIFHQHYHYFDLFTFQRLLKESGGMYLSHLYNRQGPCGGALIVAFCKAKSSQPLTDFQTTIPTRKQKILTSIKNYQHEMGLIAQQLGKFRGNIYGYGAGLMLATLAYHLRTDLSELSCVLDDDLNKDGWGYQNIPVQVRYSGHLSIEPNSNFLITSLENTRAILKKVMELSPRRILTPLIS